MINRFMISVAAAALIAGTGFANAQGTGMNREAPSAGSPAQQSAPAERASPSAAPMNRESATDSKSSEKGVKSTQSDEKKMAPQGATPGTKSQRAQDDIKAGPKGEKSAQDNDMNKGSASKNMRSETNEKGAAGKDMKAEGREGRNGNMNAEQKGGAADSKSQTTTQSQTGQSSQSTTTGQAGAGGKLSTEQRTKISTVIKSQHVAPLTNVNFSISVGTRVPRGVSFHPLPAEVVTIYPEWRGYEFILVRDQILVIDPRTLEIVAVLEV
jgi:Protein of unknown function (DUF1236)